MSRTPTADPAGTVAQPVASALNFVIIGAVGSFALSVATVVTAVLTPDGPLHEVAHFLLLGAMGAVVVGRVVHLLRGRSVPGSDVWARAREVDPTDARLAQVLTVAVPLAWLVGSAAILVHHLPGLHGPALVIGAWLPMAAVLWIVATFSWQDYCRDRIAAALDESDRRFREYWRDVARTP